MTHKKCTHEYCGNCGVRHKNAEIENENSQPESLEIRRSDDLLAHDVDISRGRHVVFAEKSAVWIASAVEMLKNHEWAEAMPLDTPILCDLEAQISELVGLSTRYTEIQHKFSAACRTLESLGFKYLNEGDTHWTATETIDLTPYYGEPEIKSGCRSAWNRLRGEKEKQDRKKFETDFIVEMAKSGVAIGVSDALLVAKIASEIIKGKSNG